MERSAKTKKRILITAIALLVAISVVITRWLPSFVMTGYRQLNWILGDIYGFKKVYGYSKR